MAKRYQFRLQPVLRHRERVEEQKQVELADAQRARQSEEEKLAALQGQEARAVELLEQQGMVGRLDVEFVKQGLSYLQTLAGDIDTQEEAVTEAQEQAEERRQETVRAMQDRKVLEKLRERGRQRWQQEVNREESRFLDELAVTRHKRGRPLGQPPGKGRD